MPGFAATLPVLVQRSNQRIAVETPISSRRAVSRLAPATIDAEPESDLRVQRKPRGHYDSHQAGSALGTEFGLDFERYKNLEDGSTKSEAGFIRFLEREQALTKAERNKRFRSYLYNSVLEHKDNALARYVSTGNRSTDDKPLTVDMLNKSLFACFLYSEPVEDNMTTDAYKRDDEIENNVLLMKMLYDLALHGYDRPKKRSYRFSNMSRDGNGALAGDVEYADGREPARCRSPR